MALIRRKLILTVYDYEMSKDTFPRDTRSDIPHGKCLINKATLFTTGRSFSFSLHFVDSPLHSTVGCWYKQLKVQKQFQSKVTREPYGKLKAQSKDLENN